MESNNDSNYFNNIQLLPHLGRFTDIVCALAVGLTFLGFHLPEGASSMNDGEVNKYLISQLEPLANYLGSFFLIVFYWIEHTQRFVYYKRTDESHLWISALYLMSMLIMPYSNDLIISFPQNSLVKVWYSLNIFSIGIFSWSSWIYATFNYRLIDGDLDAKTIKSISIKSLIEPLFSLVMVLVAFLNQSLWDYVWFLIPVVYIAVDKYIEKSTSPTVNGEPLLYDFEEDQSLNESVIQEDKY
ncbi:MAG: DUF1211 domain-containing protein [Scytonematopsis contorta HA4267-MV1]|jgi:uncharacterized membrane protein|nr:DUF1211 domain-containing protein [Scytonematopsis contorta HA4267-MV1]